MGVLILQASLPGQTLLFKQWSQLRTAVICVQGSQALAPLSTALVISQSYSSFSQVFHPAELGLWVSFAAFFFNKRSNPFLYSLLRATLVQHSCQIN